VESIPTAEAAEQVGVNVQKYHRVAAKLGVEPTFRGPGRTGVKFWHPRDVEHIRRELAAVAKSSAA
jgi:hypothetical protein